MAHMTVRNLGRAWLFAMRVVTGIAGAALLVMLLVTVVEIGWRGVSGRTVPGLLGTAEVLLVIVVFASIAYALREGEHVELSVLMDRIRPEISRRITGVGMLIAAGALALLFYHAALVALQSYRIGEYHGGLVHVPIWPGRAVVAIGLLMLVVECVAQGVAGVLNRSFTIVGHGKGSQ